MAKHKCVVTIDEKGDIVNKPIIRLLFSTLKQGSYLVEVKSTDKRSNAQNRFYWGLVVPLVKAGLEDMGHDELTSEDVHGFLKIKFNYLEIVNTDTAEVEYVPKSTTRLNKGEFNDFIAKIQKWSAEFLNIVIPDPGTQTTIGYADEQLLQGKTSKSNGAGKASR